MARQGHMEFGEVEESRGSCYRVDVDTEPDWDVAIVKVPTPNIYTRRRSSRYECREVVLKELLHLSVITPKFIEEWTGHDAQLSSALQALDRQWKA